MNTLNKVRTGDTVSVVKIHGQGSTRRRIMDMGITKARKCLSAKLPPGRSY